MARKDAELIQSAREGDVDAVRTLIETRYADLYRFCRRLLASQADAEAATRQILGLALTGEARDATLEGVALQVCRMWRERRHHDSLPPDEQGVGDRFAAAATESDDARLLAAVDRLALEHRIPLLLKHLLEVPDAEICRLLGVSEKALRVRLSNARSRMAEDTGVAPDQLDGRVAAVLAAVPASEEYRRTILAEALGAQEKSSAGTAVLAAALAAIAFIVAVAIFVAVPAS
jgi:RNA polymerase sigma-70 factor (ECF subfamily)